MRKTCTIVIACLILAGCSSNPEKPAAASVAKSGPAPDLFNLDLDTSNGRVVVEIHRDWAPKGVDHLYDLVKSGFYDGDRFFRYSRDFIVQFGINGDPSTNGLWAQMRIPDDPVKQSNTVGTLTFATAGPATRTTQLFFNLKDNRKLDDDGFAPLGKVITGMDVVQGLFRGYGEIPDMGGRGPNPSLIQSQGNAYLAANFPHLDYIKKATIQ